MSALDLLAFAARALRGHRLRTALSLLGVAIGVAAVVTLTALGEGARRYVLAQFASVGTNMVAVLPGKTETTGAMPGFGGVPHDLTLDDALAVLRGVREVDKVAPMVVGTETVAFGERRRQVALMGGTHRGARGAAPRHRARALPAGDPLGPRSPCRGARHSARAGALPRHGSPRPGGADRRLAHARHRRARAARHAAGARHGRRRRGAGRHGDEDAQPLGPIPAADPGTHPRRPRAREAGGRAPADRAPRRGGRHRDHPGRGDLRLQLDPGRAHHGARRRSPPSRSRWRVSGS